MRKSIYYILVYIIYSLYLLSNQERPT